MRCAKCGTHFPDSAKFCSSCGRKLNVVRVTVEGDVLQPPSRPANNRSVQPQQPRRPLLPPGGQNRGHTNQPQHGQQRQGSRPHPRPNAEYQRRTHLGIPTKLHTDGAVVVYTSERQRGIEVSLYLTSLAGTTYRANVSQRRVLGQPVFAAVFPRIPTGTYRVFTTAAPPTRDVTVFSGAVAEVDWRQY